MSVIVFVSHMYRFAVLLTSGFFLSVPVAHAGPRFVNLLDLNPLGTLKLEDILCGIANSIFTLAITAAVIAFLLAAFYYFTSGGNAARVAKGKSALFYAAIGTAVAILAWGAAIIIASLLGGEASGIASC